MRVSIDRRGDDVSWDDGQIERLALFALQHMEVPESCEVSISLVDESEIQQLNRDFRNVDSVTDVLSFPCDDPWEADACAPGPDPLVQTVELGDVVMCCDVIDEQRAQFGTTFEQEASLMLVHSILHLLGYDHMDADEARQMEALEKEILDAYGLTGVRA